MASPARRRMSGGPGPGQWLALGGAVLVILGLTFALGLLVGRQWARQAVSPLSGPSVAEAARKPATPPRRNGIAAEVMADRPPESTEKLTFYQTLTEPLNGPGAPPKPVALPTPAALKVPAAAPAPAAPSPVSLPPAPTVASAQTPWTIQVGAYKNRRQAEDTRQHLTGSGLDAYVVALAAQDGQARFRVRVGTYRTREEAAAAAERIRAQRSLTTFVTPK